MSAFILQRQMKSGAYNFYWIAGLSMATSIFYNLRNASFFVVGMGLTQFLDILFHNLAVTLPNNSTSVRILSLFVDFSLCSVFVLCGIFASRGHRLAFIAGMILYGLDAILTLLSLDFIGFGFHVFFLWFLFTGLQALNRMGKIVPEPPTNSPIPRGPGAS